MVLNYEKFCELPAYVITVKQLQESKERFEYTKKQLHSIGIKNVIETQAVFVQEEKKIIDLVEQYKMHNFKGRDTHLACTLSFIHLWEQLLKTNEDYFLICEDDLICAANSSILLKEYLDQLPNNWDVLHLGALIWKEAAKLNTSKKFISSLDWYSDINNQTTNLSRNGVPWGGTIGGWCNIYTRKALCTFLENTQSIFTITGDAAFNIVYRDFGLNFLCINRPAEHPDNNALPYRAAGASRVLRGLVYQVSHAKFISLNDKYHVKRIKRVGDFKTTN
jgi:GR25 family glycosyltransferase involved in LPS biosynthesis